jgi:hypothetical protein
VGEGRDAEKRKGLLRSALLAALLATFLVSSASADTLATLARISTARKYGFFRKSFRKRATTPRK